MGTTRPTLKQTVIRYINADLYFRANERKILDVDFMLREIGKIEDSLVLDFRVTDKQIEKLLYYGKYFFSLGVTKIAEPQLVYILKFVFPKKTIS